MVADGRGKEPHDVYPLADGSIYTGLMAYNLGLVDELGGLKEAIDLAAELAEISEPNPVWPYKRDNSSIFDLLNGLLGGTVAEAAASFSGPQLMYLCRF